MSRASGGPDMPQRNWNNIPVDAVFKLHKPNN